MPQVSGTVAEDRRRVNDLGAHAVIFTLQRVIEKLDPVTDRSVGAACR